MKKIIRSICYFAPETKDLNKVEERLDALKKIFEKSGFEVQTLRICCSSDLRSVLALTPDPYFLSAGMAQFSDFTNNLSSFMSSKVSLNVDLTDMNLSLEHAQVFFDLMKTPESMFRFCVNFEGVRSSPFFPSASGEVEGFSIGLQSPDLAQDCESLPQWFDQLKVVWQEIMTLTASDPYFLGIDSSVAPMGGEGGSLVKLVEKLCKVPFVEAVLSDAFLQITEFIKENNPKPQGLNGLMFPTMEDEGLVTLYEEGQFTLERNLFLSLHSGTGIDTYPLGVDESPEQVLRIMRLVQGLARKYQKPLSIRFVSDGSAKIGDRTDFKNPFLYDCKVRALL